MTAYELVARRDLDDGRIRVLTLQRPEQRNPIDTATLDALRVHLEAADADDDARAVAITGAGDAFSAGGDLRGYVAMYADEPAFRAFLENFAAACALLERGRFASIAMVNGACVAGGLEVALSCDLIVASDTARIGDGHLNFGQLPGAGGSQRLCRAIGFQKAKELLLTGRLLSGAEAAEIGLVALAVPAGDLEARTLDLVREMVGHSPLAVRRMKELIQRSQGPERARALDDEMAIVIEYATTSYDAVEGLRAFADRREPDWRGE